MSNSPSPRQSLGSLTIGNVISAALRIYRDHFSVYYKLAFIACLWLLVPIYGWAKFAAISGLISRLTYREIIGSPETIHEASCHVNPRLWTFFTTGLLVGLILLIPILGFGIFSIVFGFLFLSIAFLAFHNNSTMNSTMAVIIIALLIPLAILGIVVFIFGYYIWIWIFCLYCRLSLAQLAIAIEKRGKAAQAIGRSWTLTQGFVLRLLLIFFVAYLLTIPIYLLVKIIIFVLQMSIGNILHNSFIYWLLIIAIAYTASALLLPFWQAIKAVIYYDLCSRKEGINLEI